VIFARSARNDVRWVAAVFVGSDETKSVFRHLLLQIGGANIDISRSASLARPPTLATDLGLFARAN
jgi:hypothetical protein